MSNLKTYKCEFSGRPNGAIGITWKHVVVVKAENEEKALIELYKNYEHIFGAAFKEVEEVE